MEQASRVRRVKAAFETVKQNQSRCIGAPAQSLDGEQISIRGRPSFAGRWWLWNPPEHLAEYCREVRSRQPPRGAWDRELYRAAFGRRLRFFATRAHSLNLTPQIIVEVQVFGVQKHAVVRKALRFFAERRITAHFVDFKVRGPALGELRRFSERLGVAAIVDRNSKRFVELGLAPARYGDAKWLDLLMDEPMLLVLPLVRCGTKLTVGLDEAAWSQWVTDGK